MQRYATKNTGQVGLGSSRPGQISAWSHIKPGGDVFNKKRVCSTKGGGRMCDTKKHIILLTAYTIFYTTPGFDVK